MGKMRLGHFYDPVYKENFYVFFGTPKKMNKLFKEFAPFDSEGRTFYARDQKKWPGVVIWIRHSYKWHIIAHEAVHAANWLLRQQKGVRWTRTNDEALAYYVAFIVEQIMEIANEIYQD